MISNKYVFNSTLTLFINNKSIPILEWNEGKYILVKQLLWLSIDIYINKCSVITLYAFVFLQNASHQSDSLAFFKIFGF